MAEIIIEIAPDSAVKITTRGFAGTACKDATKDLEKQLGAKTSDVDTEEIHTNGAARIKNRV